MKQSGQHKQAVTSPMAAALVSINVSAGDWVEKDQIIAVVESMKMQTAVVAPAAGLITELNASVGDTVQDGHFICHVMIPEGEDEGEDGITSQAADSAAQDPADTESDGNALDTLNRELSYSLDSGRPEAVAKRHSKGYRTARENLYHLCDEDSFVEYGQLAVAAQRGRIDAQKLKTETAADGVITGLATINAAQFGAENGQVAVVINDYSVLAGTQGYFHHRKIDRILDHAAKSCLPVVMYTEGGGGRPGDTDVKTQIAGLDVPTFAAWASLSGQVPLIAVNNGYCFAGNAALFGCADIRIATKTSWIGMAGPAMIEGGGLGTFAATDIGPVDVQSSNGVLDLVADDEAHATELAQQCLSYFQGHVSDWQCADQAVLRNMMPEDRRYVYDVRGVIQQLVDIDSFLELTQSHGPAVLTGFARIEGRAVGLIANDCRHLGGAVDAEAAEKTARFITLCDNFDIPIVSLCDSPGFMVGPDSEEQAAVRRMAALFVAGAKLTTALVAVFLRKGYGLGAMAMVGGSFHKPIYSVAWPSGEFGGMGLEGAVRLGFKKELAAVDDPTEREALYEELVKQMYQSGKATEAAAHLEIDAVIDPASTRDIIVKALNSRVI